MGRVRNRKSQRSVVAFLKRLPLGDLDWLERIGPDYTWILRHLYSPVPCTVAALGTVAPWRDHVINSKRDQALYLLGYRHAISAKRKRVADHRLAEFEFRQRLTHVRDTIRLGPGDREVIRLALEHGACADAIARNSNWSLQSLRHALGRLAGLKPLKVILPGAAIRRAAFLELLESGENAKAELELRILEALDDDTGIVDLAKEWQIPSTAVSALTAEIRRELAEHPSTRAAFAALDRQRQQRNLGGTQLKWLNARLLPLFLRFRKKATPFSRRELAYLTARSRGHSITRASQQALGIAYYQATVIDRALLRQILPVHVSFPATLPLPPFTKEQRELMSQLKYAPL